MPLSKIVQSSVNSGVAGTGPAFSAYQSTLTALVAGVGTKVAYQTEEFDTANCFNNTGATVGSIPAYAFMPNVAGYYQLNFSCVANGSSDLQPLLYKNGAAFKYGMYTGTVGNDSVAMSCLVYLNGTTDYVEFYCYSSYNINTQTGQARTWVSGCLVRSA